MDFDQRVLQEVRNVLDRANGDARATGTHLLSMMIWYRTRLLEHVYIEHHGAADQASVMSGPFAGMKMPLPTHAGAPLPMMLGVYESPLHEAVRRAATRGYAHIVNIGCGDGYYAVGMARLMPDARVFGYDLNPKAQEGCRRAATLNGVADRVAVNAEFTGEDFAAHPARQTLVICDIEGGEDELLDPARYPALAGHDVIVEMHEVYRPGIGARLKERFAPTHDIHFIDHALTRAEIPTGMQNLSEFDEFLLIYEGRGGPTPWLVMTVKS